MKITKNLLLKSLFTFFIVCSVGLLITQVAFAATADVKSVGSVTFVTGDAYITHIDKTTAPAVKNAALIAGDTIETKNGRLQLALIDGGKVSLQPNTIYKINKYEFSGKEDGSEYAFTELLKGGMRTISGLIGHKNRDRYQLKTAVATIGIRGTEFTVNFNNNQLLMTTNHGSVDVCNAAGCLNAMTGQSIVVSGIGAAPKPSSKAANAAAAPPAVKTNVASKDSEDSKSSSKLDTKSDITSSSTIGSKVANSGSDSNGSSSSGSSGFNGSSSDSSGSNAGGSAPVFTATSTTSSTGLPTIIAATIKDGSGTIVSFAVTDNGKYNEVFNADLKYDKNLSLKSAESSGTEIKPKNFASFNSDGIVAWGQATGGKYNTGSNKIGQFDYIAGATPVGSLATLTGSVYSVFASTAPFLVSNANSTTITTVGASNLTGGSLLNFNFTTYTFGYNITVPTTSYGTFNLLGTGNIIGNSLVAGGTVTNNIATTCSTGCTGALGSNLIQGSFLGIRGERIGLQYGINAPGLDGKIYGGAVLK